MTRYTVVDTNFSSAYDWLYMLSDIRGNIAWLLDDEPYRKHGHTNPVHKGHLDSLAKGSYVVGEAEMLDERLAIVRIHDWGESKK